MHVALGHMHVVQQLLSAVLSLRPWNNNVHVSAWRLHASDIGGTRAGCEEYE